MSDSVAASENGQAPAEAQAIIERPPYVALLVSLSTGVTHMLMPATESDMHLIGVLWGGDQQTDSIGALQNEGVLDIDAGAQGYFQFNAKEIVFMKRITQAELEQIQRSQQQNAAAQLAASRLVAARGL